MKVWHLAVVSWIVTVLTGVFGMNAWYTIWYYQEPVIDSVAEPDAFGIAVACGLGVLALSVLLSGALSILAARADTPKKLT
jgi:Mg2+ and Co2+ transporter CorA